MLELARHRAVPIVALAFVTSVASAPTAAPMYSRPAVESQPLLALHQRVIARAAPSPLARSVGAITATTPLTNAETVLPVLQTANGPNGGRWIRVRLPTRPNGATGWVPAAVGSDDATPWQIVIHRGARRADVLRAGSVRATYPVIVGKHTTPTPLGTFFVVEKLHLAPGVPEGPWALATSAYSNVLQEFAGGPGQIALHGIVGLTAPLGTFSSHGCVRFGNAAITWIATHVAAGTPVTVVR